MLMGAFRFVITVTTQLAGPSVTQRLYRCFHSLLAIENFEMFKENREHSCSTA